MILLKKEKAKQKLKNITIAILIATIISFLLFLEGVIIHFYNYLLLDSFAECNTILNISKNNPTNFILVRFINLLVKTNKSNNNFK